MTRGNGKHAKSAQASKSGLAAYIKPKDDQSPNWAQEYVDWSEFPAELVRNAIWATNKMDGAILFGHSRRKDCYAITIFYGGETTPYYWPVGPAGFEAIVEFLNGLVYNAENGG